MFADRIDIFSSTIVVLIKQVFILLFKYYEWWYFDIKYTEYYLILRSKYSARKLGKPAAIFRWEDTRLYLTPSHLASRSLCKTTLSRSR